MEHYFVNGLAGFGGVGAVYLVARMVMFLNDLRKAAQERKEASVMSGVLQAQEIEHLKEQVKIGSVLEDLQAFLQHQMAEKHQGENGGA